MSERPKVTIADWPDSGHWKGKVIKDLKILNADFSRFDLTGTSFINCELHDFRLKGWDKLLRLRDALDYNGVLEFNDNTIYCAPSGDIELLYAEVQGSCHISTHKNNNVEVEPAPRKEGIMAYLIRTNGDKI